MNISSNTWHYRVFEWALKEKYGYVPYQIEEGGYNLCPYVRKVLIWAPLRFLFATSYERLVASVLGLVLAITGLVYKLAGMKGLRVEAGIFFLIFGVIAIVAALFGAIWSFAKLKEYLRKRQIKVGVPEVVVSFSEILWNYIKSAHEGVCPKITFTKD